MKNIRTRITLLAVLVMFTLFALACAAPPASA